MDHIGPVEKDVILRFTLYALEDTSYSFRVVDGVE